MELVHMGVQIDPVCPRPILSLSHCVSVPLCLRPIVSPSHCVSPSPTPIVSPSHYVQVPVTVCPPVPLCPIPVCPRPIVSQPLGMGHNAIRPHDVGTVTTDLFLKGGGDKRELGVVGETGYRRAGYCFLGRDIARNK